MVKIVATLADGSGPMAWLRQFVTESNRIEGILRPPTEREVVALEGFLDLEDISVLDIANLVAVFEPGAQLRTRPGMDVRIGGHLPMEGGPKVLEALDNWCNTHLSKGPYEAHLDYEYLHPFTDGNGRSGRALWLYGMKYRNRLPQVERRGFLHEFYYQTLSASDQFTL